MWRAGSDAAKIQIPPKYAVSQGCRLHQGQRARSMGPRILRQHGRDEQAIRAYIRNQEKEDQRLDQLNLWR
jgi:putative transposase